MDFRFMVNDLGLKVCFIFIVVIFNGVDVDWFDLLCGDFGRFMNWFVDEDVLMIGMVGRIYLNKG